MDRMKLITKGNPVAQLMLIGFCFEFLVEGASGFGTPVALAAPLLASLGFDRIQATVVALIFNTLATPFGAGTLPLPQ